MKTERKLFIGAYCIYQSHDKFWDRLWEKDLILYSSDFLYFEHKVKGRRFKCQAGTWTTGKFPTLRNKWLKFYWICDFEKAKTLSKHAPLGEKPIGIFNAKKGSYPQSSLALGWWPTQLFYREECECVGAGWRWTAWSSTLWPLWQSKLSLEV